MIENVSYITFVIKDLDRTATNKLNNQKTLIVLGD